jgi:hypothetical protein
MNAPADSTHCLNCGQALAGNYCANCGQAAATRRFNTSNLLRQFLQSFTNLDRGFLHTAVALTTRPGAAMLEYVKGKRVGYYNPISYLLVFTTIWLLGLKLGGLNLEKLMQQTQSSMQQEAPKESQKQSARVTATSIRINQFVAQNIDYVELLMIPIYASLFALLFRKSPRNYSEILVFQFFSRGHIQMFSLFIIPVFVLVPQFWRYYSFTKLGILLLLQWVAGPVFFECSWWAYTWRMVIANALSFASVGMAIFLIALFFLR